MKYSIVIITADKHTILKNCLDKLFEYEIDKKAEIIVVDASVNDFEYSKIDKINYVKLKPSEKGFSNQRNIGVQNVKTDYVIFIDDDIEITENWFRTLITEFEKYPDKFGAMGAVFPKQNKILSFICGLLGHPGGGFKLHSFASEKNIFLSQVATCNTIFRKQIIENVGWFDINNKFGSEDSELCLRIIKKYGYNKFVYIPSALVWHYSVNNIFKFIKWYIRRGMADIDLYLRHATYLDYVVKTSIVVKIFIVFLVSASIKNFLFLFFIFYYFWQLYKHKFVFKYFKYYNFSSFKKFFIFLIFPFLKLTADLSFDFGRIKRIIDVKIKNEKKTNFVS